MTPTLPTRCPGCNCTSYCGDDPGIREGKVRPCRGYRYSRLVAARDQQARNILRELGYPDMLAALRVLRRLTLQHPRKYKYRAKCPNS